MLTVERNQAEALCPSGKRYAHFSERNLRSNFAQDELSDELAHLTNVEPQRHTALSYH